MGKPLFVSYSSMSGFRKCPRYYYWKYIRRLEKPTLKVPYIVGRIMHHGIQTLFSKPEKAESELKKKYKVEVQRARVEFPQMEAYHEEDLAKQEYVTVGMLQAFRVYYRKFLDATKHIATEKAIKYELNKRVTVVGVIDNIIQNQGRRWIYELKNLKSLNMDKVKSIQTDPQSSLYLEVYNRTVKKADALDGIVYQIIRKPSIRQKKKESRGEYLRRLQDWYQDQTEGAKFHLERLKGSFIPGTAVINTIEQVSQQMLACGGEKDRYFQDFSYCIHDWGPCQFYDLCHGKEKEKDTLKLFQIRKKFIAKDQDEHAIDEDAANVED